MCTVSSTLDQFPYAHILHVTLKPVYLWKTFQNAMHANFLFAPLLNLTYPSAPCIDIMCQLMLYLGLKE